MMQNGILFQAFEWYCPDDGHFYRTLADRVADLAAVGVTAVWLPPVYKATGTHDVGYGVYDLYDLGDSTKKALSGRSTEQRMSCMP
jgi:alpha-amylase